MNQQVIIVDPIFRGSRLFFSWLAVSGAFKYGHDPVIITRTDARTNSYFEVFGNMQCELHEVVELPRDFWFGKISKKGVEAVIGKLVELVTGDRKTSLIYICGINEIFDPFSKLADFRIHPELKNIPVIAIDYDATFMLRNSACNPYNNRIHKRWWDIRKTFRDSRKLHIYEKLKKRIPGLHMGILDERINETKKSQLNNCDNFFVLLPDPPQNIPSKKPQITRHDPGCPINILLAGKQSARKGVLDVIRLLERNGEIARSFHFILSGKLDPDRKDIRKRIIALGENVTWHDDYVSTQELLNRFNTADFVMLPYTRKFNASSGVMVMSCQSGKPLITTDHGLIGYRVKNNGIGLTYKSGDINNLEEVLGTVLETNVHTYREMSKACIGFAKKNSVKNHQDAIFRLLEQ